MKKYIEPKIKAVTLDADQAILQVCAVGGIYMSASGGLCTTGWETPLTFTCATPNKGISKGMRNNFPPENNPS